MSDPQFDGQRNEYAAAKRAWAWILGLNVVWLVVTLVSEAVPRALTPVVLLATVLIIPVVLWFLRDYADKHYRGGEAFRTAARLSNGLGASSAPSDHAELAAAATSASGNEPHPIGDYYASNLAPGPRRLAHLLQEEAFYTKDLARRAGTRAWWFVGVILIGVFVAMFGMVHAVASGAGDVAALARVANVGMAVVGLGLSGSFADLARRYSALGETAGRVYERARALAERGTVQLRDLILILNEYDSALAVTAPIPSRIYLMHRERLDAAWRSAHVVKLERSLPRPSMATQSATNTQGTSP